MTPNQHRCRPMGRRWSRAFLLSALAAYAWIPATAADAKTELLILGATGAPGSTVSVTVALSDASTAVVGAGADLHFDTNVLDFLGQFAAAQCSVDPRLGSNDFIIGSVGAGVINLGVAPSPGAFPVAALGDGALAHCDFHIKSGAPAGATSLVIQNPLLTDALGNHLGVRAVNGTVVVGAAAGCPAIPSLCNTAGKNEVQIEDDKLGWQWAKGVPAAAQSDFGNPVAGGTSYRLCIYDETAGVPVLRMGVAIPGGASCGGTACWRAVGASGWSYTDRAGTAGGIARVLLKGGAAGKPSVKVTGAGETLPLAAPFSATQFFAEEGAVTVQLSRTDAATCWSSTFTALGTTKNTVTEFKATSP